jgi:hypothetical protein
MKKWQEISLVAISVLIGGALSMYAALWIIDAVIDGLIHILIGG